MWELELYFYLSAGGLKKKNKNKSMEDHVPKDSALEGRVHRWDVSLYGFKMYSTVHDPDPIFSFMTCCAGAKNVEDYVPKVSFVKERVHRSHRSRSRFEMYSTVDDPVSYTHLTLPTKA